VRAHASSSLKPGGLLGFRPVLDVHTQHTQHSVVGL
jgi:hypothetical protein